MKIRKVTLEDVDALKKIAIKTFMETYASQNSEADMKLYLENNFSIANLKVELKDKKSAFYFAELATETVGYIKVKTEQSKTNIDELALEIQRIYVLKAFQGKRIGQKLYNKAFEIAQIKRVAYIWLGVWEKNLKAIEFYKKNGFVVFGTHTFKLGDDLQTDWTMKFELS